LRKG
jgi:hypothetical protein